MCKLEPRARQPASQPTTDDRVFIQIRFGRHFRRQRPSARDPLAKPNKRIPPIGALLLTYFRARKPAQQRQAERELAELAASGHADASRADPAIGDLQACALAPAGRHSWPLACKASPLLGRFLPAAQRSSLRLLTSSHSSACQSVCLAVCCSSRSSRSLASLSALSQSTCPTGSLGLRANGAQSCSARSTCLTSLRSASL